MKFLSDLKSTHFFFGTFVLVIFVQSLLWFTLPSADEHFWRDDAKKIAAGEALGPLDITYIHPGTTVLYPSAGFMYFAIEPSTAFRLAMILLLSIAIALIVLAAREIDKTSLWWLALLLILGTDTRLLQVTPPSAVAAVLTVLYAVLLITLVSSKKHTILIFLGICAGALLATRIDTGGFILLTSLPLIALAAKLRIVVFFAATWIAFICLNPHMWTAPVTQVVSIYQQITANVTIDGIAIFSLFISTYPFALLSIFMSMIVMGILELKPIPRRVYFWLLGSTLLFTALFAAQSFHPVRYFMPLYLIWDILLPVWIFTLAKEYLPRLKSILMGEKAIQLLTIAAIVVVAFIQLLRTYTAEIQGIVL